METAFGVRVPCVSCKKDVGVIVAKAGWKLRHHFASPGKRCVGSNTAITKPERKDRS